MKVLRTALMTTGIALAMTVTANAATVSYERDAAALAAAAGTTSNSLAGGTWVGTAPSERTGSVGGSHRSPYQPGAGEATNPYFAVGPAHVTNVATLAFTSLQSTFSFLWGSVDDHNEVELCNNTGCETIDTAVLSAQLPGYQSGLAQIYITITNILGGAGFNSISFITTVPQNAFEWAAMQSTPRVDGEVPLPLSVLLLGSGLLGLGFLGRKQRKAATA